MQSSGHNHQQSNKIGNQTQVLTNNMTINNKLIDSEAITNQNELKHHPGSPFYIPNSKSMPGNAEDPEILKPELNQEELPVTISKYGKKLFKPVDLTSNNNNCKRFLNNNTKTSNNKKIFSKKCLMDEKNRPKVSANTNNGIPPSDAMDVDMGENVNTDEKNRTFNSAIVESNTREQSIGINNISNRSCEMQFKIEERFHNNRQDDGFKSDINKTIKNCTTPTDMDVDIERRSPDQYERCQSIDENNENLSNYNEQSSNFSVCHTRTKSPSKYRHEKDYSSVFQEHLKRSMNNNRRLDTSDDEGRQSHDGALSPNLHSDTDPSPKAYLTNLASNDSSQHDKHQSIINCLQSNYMQGSTHPPNRGGSKFNDKYDIVNLIKKENNKVDNRAISSTPMGHERLTSPINVTLSPRSSPSIASSPAFSERIYESGDGETQQYLDDAKTTRQLKFSVDNILDPNKFTGKAGTMESGTVADHMTRILIGQNILNSYKHLQSHWRPHLEFLSHQHQHDFLNHHTGKLSSYFPIL